MEDNRALYASINDPVPRKPRLRGSQFLDTAEQKFAQAAQTVQGWAEDKEGIGDDITRLGLGGVKNIAKVASLPGISHALRIAGAPAWAAGQAIGAGLEHGLGVDPRYGHIAGEVGEWFIPGYGVTKLGKAGKLARRIPVPGTKTRLGTIGAMRNPARIPKATVGELSDRALTKADELKQIIAPIKEQLKNIPKTIIDGKRVKISPLSRQELEPIAARVQSLKKELGIKKAGEYIEDLGAVTMDDGHLARLGSKGKFKSTKQQIKRGELESMYPADESRRSDRLKISGAAGATHKHHVRVLEPSKVFTVINDGKGGFKPRHPEQIKRVTNRLKEDGILVGNQDLNEIFQSRAAHLGERGSPTSQYASHSQIKRLTDLQGPSNIPGKTYNPRQFHGFSEEGQKMLASITKDEDLYEAIKLYYEISDEAYKGAAGLASKVIDSDINVDTLTKRLLQQYSPEVREWITTLQKMPQHKNDPRLLQALLKNNKDQYINDLIKDATRPSLFKN